MGDLCRIKPREAVGVQQDLLDDLYQQLGPARAEDVLCRALHQMMYRLGRAEALLEAGKSADMALHLRRMAVIAEQIGLSDLAQVARAVQGAIDQRDAVATIATFHRLRRNLRVSITALGDLRDLSI